MFSTSSERITGGFNRREAWALTEIYDTYRKFFFGRILQMVGNPEDAEDILAHAFTALLEQKGHFDRLGRIKSFIGNSSKNASLNLISRREMIASKSADLEYHYRILQDEPDEYGEISGYYMERIMVSIDRLPEKPKQVLLLYLKGDKTAAEIGQMLRISEKTVANRKSRAIRLLKMEMLKSFIVFIIRLYFRL